MTAKEKILELIDIEYMKKSIEYHKIDSFITTKREIKLSNELTELQKLKQIVEGLDIFDAQSWLGEKKDI
jgi:hypothetical protein